MKTRVLVELHCVREVEITVEHEEGDGKDGPPPEVDDEIVGLSVEYADAILTKLAGK